MKAVQLVMKCFPLSYGAGLFREVLLEREVTDAFAGISEQYCLQFKEEMGVIYTFGEHTVSAFESILILAVTVVVFFLLSVWNLSRKKK